jgi:adenylate kinase
MNPQTIILMGPQGSGKGTQAELLSKIFVERGESLLHFETGNAFRSFMKGDGYTQRRVAETMARGSKPEAFLPIFLWSTAFIDKLTKADNIIIDGSPRAISEARVLDTAMTFYARAHPTVFVLDLSEEKAIERLLIRARDDDTKEAIKERLRWYIEEVVPIIDYYRHNSRYRVVEINGDQTINEVHRDIVASLQLD